MNYIDLRKLSLEFRRLSSNLLNSTNDDADINLTRFLKFINSNELITNILHNKIEGIEYDFKECFLIESDGWANYNIPKDEGCHLKAQYDYMMFIDSTEQISVRNQALCFCWSDKKINTIIQKFVDKSFKPFIDFINDQISMEMIVRDEERKINAGNTFIQNIETVNGTANQQASGTINNYNFTDDINNILLLIDKIIPSLSSLSDIDTDEIESVKDDLEMIQEQLKTAEPKKSRLSKALLGVKNFVRDFSMKLALAVGVDAITNADWNTLIQQLETFIENIHI